MGIPTGAVKYFIGVGTSLWGILSAYLFAKSILEPMDYIEGVRVFLTHQDDPNQLVIGIIEIFITTPAEFAKLAVVGLMGMTFLWVYGMLKAR